MYATMNNKTICLAEYTAAYNYLTVQECCNELARAFFKIIFKTQEYVFFTIDEVMDYLLELSLILDKSLDKEAMILDDIQEILTFVIESCWKGDFHAI
ncbi:MAG: hypothetical protein ACRDDX_08330 [Cellulosilyticaceae bacterium]